MTIEFNLEGRDKSSAFFALYAGLRMYYEQKLIETKERDKVTIPGAEAFALLEDLRHQNERLYLDAVAEYEHVYG